jgi:hypothetical protein
MRFFPSDKLNRRSKYLLTLALLLAYILGFASKVYSPAHIRHQAIPIPRLIPIVGRLPSSSQSSADSKLQANSLGSRPKTAPAFNHLNIITTFFWVGEPADSDNGNISNQASTWDGQWQQHFGGVDSPAPRNGYAPAGFTPRENTFYFALPYSDINSKGQRKTTAAKCPLAAGNNVYSWCKNSWIAIRHNGKVAYAQWEDAGPFGEDDVNYVFGSSPPANKKDGKAGLDVSPAIRDYLGLQDVDTADWGFLPAQSVPDGPWKLVITTTLGDRVD